MRPIVPTCGYNSRRVYMSQTVALVSNSSTGLSSTGPAGCDNLAHPLRDPWLIKLSARKCPSLRFLPLLLNQHLSSTPISAAMGTRTQTKLRRPLPSLPWLSGQKSPPHGAADDSNVRLESNNRSAGGFPDPPSVPTLSDKGLWVYLRKQSAGRGWSGLTDRLVQPRPTSCLLRTLIRRKD